MAIQFSVFLNKENYEQVMDIFILCCPTKVFHDILLKIMAYHSVWFPGEMWLNGQCLIETVAKDKDSTN